MYEDVIVPLGDAESLVYYVWRGVRVEEGRRRRFEEGQPLPEDLGNNEDMP